MKIRMSLAATAAPVLVLSAACLLLTLPLAAQEAAGRVVGVVTDPTGASIPKAKVTVTNTGTNTSNETQTADDGSYQVLLLPAGMYRVTAEAQGFRKVVTNPEKLDIN